MTNEEYIELLAEVCKVRGLIPRDVRYEMLEVYADYLEEEGYVLQRSQKSSNTQESR